MDALGFVMDHMGHFAPIDIANLLFAMLIAALLGYLWSRFGPGQAVQQAKESALWAALTALATGLVRAQLPLAVALLAIIMLVRGRESNGADRLAQFGALVIGLGCGSGASLVVIAIAIPFILVARWAFRGKRD